MPVSTKSRWGPPSSPRSGSSRLPFSPRRPPEPRARRPIPREAVPNQGDPQTMLRTLLLATTLIATPALADPVHDAPQRQLPQLMDYSRDFHANPELSLHETRTAA